MSSICYLNTNINESCLPDKVKDILTENFDNKECDDEIGQHKELCMIKSAAASSPKEVSDILKQYILQCFKPETESLKGTYWINNTEIDLIQSQFMFRFPNYYYAFIHMIDNVEIRSTHYSKLIPFYDKILPLKKIDFVSELNKSGKFNYNGELKKFGFVVNTDVSSGNGIHWISFFIDFESKPITLEYFNSSGRLLNDDPNKKKFYMFLDKICNDLTYNGYPTKYITATRLQHQNDKTANCGSYSLYYIWKRLNGTPQSYFETNEITDDEMEKFRGFLWRLSSS